MEEMAKTIRCLALMTMITNWIYKENRQICLYMGMYLLQNVGSITKPKLCVYRIKT